MLDATTDTRRRHIARLLKPRSIALIGASDKPGSLGNSVIANLDREGFAGNLFLVNPKRERIGRRLCVPDIASLPRDIDVAILAIPQTAVLDTIAQLGEKGVASAVIYAAGFAEGGEEGLRQQSEIARIARETGMVIEGPNCLGLVNFCDGIPLTFIELPPATATGSDRVGIVSQSGAMAAVVATNLIARSVPLSYYISTGNEAECGVEDFVDYLVDDPETRVIAMMVEHFRNPGAFLQVARRAQEAGKPIILLHPGKSEAGRESAATHTGAMVGDYDTMRVLVEQAGVVLVDGLEELTDVTEISVRCPVAPGARIAVVTESGALKALTLDLTEALEVNLPKMGDNDSPALRAALPPFVPVTNPMDITAQGLVDPDIYGRTISALALDERIDVIVVAIIQTDRHTASIKFNAIEQALRSLGTSKPVVIAGVDEGGRVNKGDIDALRELGASYFPTPERVIRALGRLGQRSDAPQFDDVLQPLRIANLPAGAIIPEYRSKDALGTCGIAFSPCAMATDLAEAKDVAERLGYPVVIKAQSADLAHKTEAGGVILNIRDEAELTTAWNRLLANVTDHRPDLVLDGVLVENMAEWGVEMIVGARIDDHWGPVVMVGFGGVTAELLRDVVLLPADLPGAEIRKRILQLRMGAQLTGFRGAAPCDVDALVRLVQTLGQILRGSDEIREVDLNPVLVYPEGRGVIALDALILTQ